MKILIVDRDRQTSKQLSDLLAQMGHEAHVDVSKNNALQRLDQEHFDIAIIDPAPLPSAKPMAMQLRWKERDSYLYLLVLTSDPEKTEVMRSGLNDYMLKPIDPHHVAHKIGNAQFLIEFYSKLRDNVDIRTHGAVFGKRPFAQLMLSALDRTYRYAEQAFLLFLRIDNFDEVFSQLDPAIADRVAQEFSDYVSRLRRMSDFMGRTATNELVILMQRPESESEPVDAAQRFLVAIQEFKSQYFSPIFTVQLVELPMAKTLMATQIDHKGQKDLLKPEQPHNSPQNDAKQVNTTDENNIPQHSG